MAVKIAPILKKDYYPQVALDRTTRCAVSTASAAPTISAGSALSAAQPIPSNTN
jgi:hypothetical protein